MFCVLRHIGNIPAMHYVYHEQISVLPRILAIHKTRARSDIKVFFSAFVCYQGAVSSSKFVIVHFGHKAQLIFLYRSPSKHFLVIKCKRCTLKIYIVYTLYRTCVRNYTAKSNMADKKDDDEIACFFSNISYYNHVFDRA